MKRLFMIFPNSRLPRFVFPAVCLFFSLAVSSQPDEFYLTVKGEAYDIPAILSLPRATVSNTTQRPASRVPAVLLLHGTASQKDEVGGLFASLAARLRSQGIASLRIDFAGTGQSPVDYEQYTLFGSVRDSLTALAFLQQHPRIHDDRIAVLGFSQGGLIAQRLITSAPELAGLVTWSTVAMDGIGSFQGFFDEYFETAKRDGFAAVSYPWLSSPLHFSVEWFEQISDQQTLTAMEIYEGPIFAIAGAADESVPYQQSIDLIAQSTNSRSRAVVLAGANHIFNVLADQPIASPTHAEQLLAMTTAWFRDELFAAN